MVKGYSVLVIIRPDVVGSIRKQNRLLQMPDHRFHRDHPPVCDYFRCSMKGPIVVALVLLLAGFLWLL
eukprot:5313718-Heterocapsa_arctica.AAC.1